MGDEASDALRHHPPAGHGLRPRRSSLFRPFADQAVIAIRTHVSSTRLDEALEQQRVGRCAAGDQQLATGTVEPVFETIVSAPTARAPTDAVLWLVDDGAGASALTAVAGT